MENTARTIGMGNFGIWDSFEKLVISKTSNDLETSPASFWRKDHPIHLTISQYDNESHIYDIVNPIPTGEGDGDSAPIGISVIIFDWVI